MANSNQTFMTNTHQADLVLDKKPIQEEVAIFGSAQNIQNFLSSITSSVSSSAYQLLQQPVVSTFSLSLNGFKFRLVILDSNRNDNSPEDLKRIKFALVLEPSIPNPIFINATMLLAKEIPTLLFPYEDYTMNNISFGAIFLDADSGDDKETVLWKKINKFYEPIKKEEEKAIALRNERLAYLRTTTFSINRMEWEEEREIIDFRLGSQPYGTNSRPNIKRK